MLLANIARYLNIIKLEIGYVSLLEKKTLCLISIIDNVIRIKNNAIMKIPNDSINFDLNGNQIWQINQQIITHSDCIDIIKETMIISIPKIISKSIDYIFDDQKVIIKNGFTSIQTIIQDKLKGKCNIIVMIEKIKIHTSKKNKRHLYIICNANNIKFNIIKWNISVSEEQIFKKISFVHPVIFSSILIKCYVNYYFVIQPETIVIYDYIIPIKKHLECKKSINYWHNFHSKKQIKFTFPLNEQKIGLDYKLLKTHAQKLHCSSKWFIFNSQIILITSPTVAIKAFCYVCNCHVTIADNKCEVCSSIIEISNQKLMSNVFLKQTMSNYHSHQFKLNIGLKQIIQFLLIYQQNYNLSNVSFEEIKHILDVNDTKQLQKKSIQQILTNIIETVIKKNKNCIFECTMQKSNKNEKKLYNLKYKNYKQNQKKKKKKNDIIYDNDTIVNKKLTKKATNKINAFSILMSSQKCLSNTTMCIKKKKNFKKQNNKKNNQIKNKNIKIFINLDKIHQRKENIKCFKFQRLMKPNTLLLFDGIKID